jgi:hypothetical protein
VWGCRSRVALPRADHLQALVGWARIEGAEPGPTARTFEVIAQRYIRDVIPGKAPRSDTGDLAHSQKLLGHRN